MSDLDKVVALIDGLAIGTIGRAQHWDSYAKKDALDAAIETATESMHKLLPEMTDELLIPPIKKLSQVYVDGKVPDRFNLSLRGYFREVVVAVNAHPNIPMVNQDLIFTLNAFDSLQALMQRL